ncbi:hypothetical protein [Nocardia asteroides]|uniref:hypothetical protein n=1 Tax=Nocardia asteroides TaxID=1824 RepID=UPI0033DF61A5
MRRDPLARFWIHTVPVRRKVGDGAYGPVLADAVDETGNVAVKTQMVRDSSGDEVVSSASIVFPPSVTEIPPGSEVDIPAAFGARTAKVIAVSRSSMGKPFPDTHAIFLE